MTRLLVFVCLALVATAVHTCGRAASLAAAGAGPSTPCQDCIADARRERNRLSQEQRRRQQTPAEAEAERARNSAARAARRASQEPDEAAAARALHAAGEAARRAALSPDEAAAVREADAAAHAARRATQPPDEAAAERVANAAAHAAARAEARNAQGPYTKCMPANMPTDAYFNTFETNPYAMEASFWARSGSYRFEAWRDLDLSTIVPGHPQFEPLTEAMREEALPTDADLLRCRADYADRAGDPTIPYCACAACGVGAVPIGDANCNANGEGRQAIGNDERARAGEAQGPLYDASGLDTELGHPNLPQCFLRSELAHIAL